MTDLVQITDRHHLRIEPAGEGVILIVLDHDEPGAVTIDFEDAEAADLYAAEHYGATAEGWGEVTLKPFDLIRVADTDPDPTLRGLTGHIVGLTDPVETAAWLDALEQVVCLKVADVVATGGVLPADQRPGAREIGDEG